MKKLFTSESVTMGHPDKICDRIADAILDEIIRQDRDGRVACEVCCTTGMVLVTGEITTTAQVDYLSTVRNTLNEIGYDNSEAGFDGNECAVLFSIDKQSPDIALGTNNEVGGAGDQGMMFGYACKETSDFMPLPITLAHRLSYRLTQTRKSGTLPFLLPDGKTQVTVEYGEDGKASRIDTIVVSSQHIEDVSQKEIAEGIRREVIDPVLQNAAEESCKLDIDSYRLFINPTGRFVKGGPSADTGMTGRKIIADTYGGYVPHGGGAFSGKDPTKVDRSAAYAARHIAKNIVAAGLANQCQVQLAYAIGLPEPVSVGVDTFGTETVREEKIVDRIRELYDLTPTGIINRFDLKKPIYKNTSAYGHFGNVIGEKRSWEKLDTKEDFDALRRE